MRLLASFLVSVLFVSVINLPSAPPALADSSGLELSELLVDPASPQTDASDEFVELHNVSGADVQLSDFKLRVGSSSTLHSLPTETIPVDGFVVLTSADSPWALTNTGGTITLVGTGGTDVDTTTWPKAVTGAGWMKGADGTWAWTASPTPGTANVLQAAASAAVPGAGGAYPELEINELLPDPAAPQTDAADEFVELFNPNDQPVSVKGYLIKTGASLSTKHSLPDMLVPAGGYLALRSADTKIALANAGSSVALFDPAGAQLGATVTYAKAKAGVAWARFDDRWEWTAEPSPGGPNILSEPPVTATAGTSSKSSSKAAKTSKAKASSSKTKAKAKAKTKTSSKAGTGALSVAATPSGSWLLLVLAGLTMAYVAYEFRHDLLNFYFRIRRHPGRRSPTLKTTQGRGRD